MKVQSRPHDVSQGNDCRAVRVKKEIQIQTQMQMLMLMERCGDSEIERATT